MRHFKALAIIATAGGALASNDTENHLGSSLSTIYVTAPASPTKPIYATNYGSTAASVKGPSTTTEDLANVTATHYLATTQVVNIVQKSSEIDEKGESPAASVSFEIVTSYVTFEPIPLNTACPVSEGPAKTLADKVVSTIFPSGKSYTGIGPAGWNATTFATVTTGSSEFAKPPVQTVSTGFMRSTKPVKNTHSSVHGTGHPSLEDASTGKAGRQLEARDVFGDVVVATIDGVEVSWTNYNDRFTPTTSTPAGTVDISAPTTTVGIYPWDLNFEPVAPAVNTTSIPSTLTPELVNISSTSSAATTQSSSCGDISVSFIVSFDDLPHFDVSSSPDDTDIPPIFNPYRKLYWQDHFGYVPAPSDPFPPHSPPQLAVYRASNNLSAVGSPDAGLEMIGEIGAGSRASDSAYWIDAHSMWFGCSDGGNIACEVIINGYTSEFNGISVSQTIDQPPCPGLNKCSLTHVLFDDSFVGLSGLQILATVEGTQVDYYVDDLELSWSNSSCAAQQERSSAQ